MVYWVLDPGWGPATTIIKLHFWKKKRIETAFLGERFFSPFLTRLLEVILRGKLNHGMKIIALPPIFWEKKEKKNKLSIQYYKVKCVYHYFIIFSCTKPCPETKCDFVHLKKHGTMCWIYIFPCQSFFPNPWLPQGSLLSIGCRNTTFK